MGAEIDKRQRSLRDRAEALLNQIYEGSLPRPSTNRQVLLLAFGPQASVGGNGSATRYFIAVRK